MEYDRKKNGMTEEQYYMTLALREAGKAAKNGDVPIGCVIVFDGKHPASKAYRNAEALGIPPKTILGRGYNQRNLKAHALKHAELIAIDKACKKLHDWRLEDCTMYVTLEPCVMCAGALVQSRLTRLVIGARNEKAGCSGSVMDLLHVPKLNHQVEMREGVLREQCEGLLRRFFREIRERQRRERNGSCQEDTDSVFPRAGCWK